MATLLATVNDGESLMNYLSAHSENLPEMLSQPGYEKAANLLRQLQVRFPKREFESLLLDSLDVSLKNLNRRAFKIYTLENWQSPISLPQKTEK